MDLYLMRHGQAGAASSDAMRPLSADGRLEVETMAAAASQRIHGLDAIRHSHRLRAQQTAELLAATLQPRLGTTEMAGIDSGDEPDILFHALEGESDSLLLVTHLPFVGHLAGLLLTGSAERSPISFTTATLAYLRGNGSRWEFVWALEPGGS